MAFSTQNESFKKQVAVADLNAKEGTFQAEILTVKAEKDTTPIWIWIVIGALSVTVLSFGSVLYFRKRR